MDQIEIIPSDRVISTGLTPVPTLSMKAMFAPFASSYKHDKLIKYKHKMKSGVSVEIQSCGLNVQTDFGIFSKVMQCIADNKLYIGEIVSIPFSEFKDKSINVDLNGGASSRVRLSNSLKRLQTISVSYSDGDVSEGSADKWISHNAFNSIGFDFSNNTIIIQCNEHLAEWYSDSFRQILVGQFNQIDKFYARSVYLYLESINGSDEHGRAKSLNVRASTLRDLWFLQELDGIKNPRSRQQRTRNIHKHIIEAFDDLRHLQYFETFEAIKIKDKNGHNDMSFTFCKAKRKKRERLLLLDNPDIETESLIDSGMVIKPVRARLPKRPYKLDDSEHVEESIDWALDCYLILTKYEKDLLDYNSKGLLHRDRSSLATVTTFLRSNGVPLKTPNKPTAMLSSKVKRLLAKKENIMEVIADLEHMIIMKTKMVFDLDASAIVTNETKEFNEFLGMSKATREKWNSAQKDLKSVNLEINES
ncbi:hypothetical protein [Moritella sp. F3]|uniref:hypothetical protein n=1 Tax=Moritella sp. F3 TaxID=2718882 RepID=UPI0018E171BF|nr:hypothetical protein [Moritella sp. F3]